MAGSKSPQTFHRFPDLPSELRVKIWEKAILPRPSPYNGAISYLHIFPKPKPAPGNTCYNANSLPLGKASYTVPAGQESDAPGRSPGVWDLGMTRACSESRHVFYRFAKSIRDIHEKFKRQRGSNGKYPAPTREWVEWIRSQPVPINVTWTDVPANYFIEVFQAVCGAEPQILPSGITIRAPDIAVDFDPAWIDDIPSQLSQLPRERGMIMVKAIFAVLSELKMGDFPFRLWLIERSSDIILHKQVAEQGTSRMINPQLMQNMTLQEEPNTFYDFDMVYKPAKRSDNFIEYPGDRSASFFHYKMSRMLVRSSPCRLPYGASIRFTYEDIDRYMGILVPFKSH